MGIMAMKEYSSFSIAPGLLNPQNQIVQGQIQDTSWRSFTPLQIMQSVYSAALAD